MYDIYQKHIYFLLFIIRECDGMYTLFIFFFKSIFYRDFLFPDKTINIIIRTTRHTTLTFIINNKLTNV